MPSKLDKTPPENATIPAPPRLKVLYEGEDVVAVQKPSGVAVHRGWAPEKDVVMRRLRNQLRRWVWPIHRLDRGTSGVLLFALSREKASKLGILFQEGNVKKSYLAIVRGVPPGEARIDYAIPRSEGGSRVDAATRYRVLEAREGYALVKAWPEQGRFHQLRRHFKHIRHPIIGDTNYGDGKRNRLWREQYGLFRLGLHALSLEFEDPDSGESVRITAPLPEDFEEALLKLGVSPQTLSAATDVQSDALFPARTDP